MKIELRTLKSQYDDTDVFYRTFTPDSSRAVICVLHGMSEHSGRYVQFAEEMATGIGATVVAPDHRGHGRTCCPNPESDMNDLGTFKASAKFSSTDCLGIMARDAIEAINAGGDQSLPVIIFGHSMGSLIARCLMRVATPGLRSRIRLVILSGVPTVPALYERLPLLWLVNSALVIGKGRDTLHHFIMDKFDDEARRILKNKNLPRNCFISSVKSVIDEFNADPLCGQTVDLRIWKSVRRVVIDLMKPNKFFSDWQADENKPSVLFISGKNDPVCKGGKTATSDADGMKKLGFQVDEILIEGCLHEFLHEESEIRQKGTSDCLNWARSKL